MAKTLEILALHRNQMEPYIEPIAALRVHYFQNYPYLYEGALIHERAYLTKLMSLPKAILTVAKLGEKIVGFCAGMPLNSSDELLHEAKDVFYGEGLDPSIYFYYDKMIILPAYRNGRTLLKIIEKQEQWAKSNGFMFGCFLTVVRKPHDVRIPRNYRPLEPLWQRCGYKRMQISLYQQWSTIQPDGFTEEKMNELEFWEKLL